MSFDKLFGVLGDDVKLKSFVSNISNGFIDTPYIMSETVKILDDDSVMINLISDVNKKALCVMLDQYFTDCYDIYIDNKPLDKLLKFGKIEVYKVNASNGLRYATTNEVAQGIKGLIGEDIYPAGENEYKLLCLLNWTFTGVSYYFRQAGYKLDYDENGKAKNTFYEMIQMSAQQLKELFTWVSVRNNYDSAIKKIERMKRNNGYKYASYEKDEITEDITIKQLVYNIYQVFPRQSPNVEYRRALALAIKSYKNKKPLTPLEISSLRDIYEKHALDKNRGAQLQGDEINELKEKCERLVSERRSGKISPTHFAYTIIDTLKKTNYTKCSVKQQSIIDDALKILDRSTDKTVQESETKKTEILSESEIDYSLSSLSNAIGQGLFEEEEEA